MQDAIADNQSFHLRTHEAPERIFRRADDRLAANVEAGVDKHGTPRAPFEC